ncbi:choice-of-anchor L domain-containing protein [Bacteroidota bacterium]
MEANYTPQQLVKDVLIGSGVQISNVKFTGNASARGFFDGSSSNIGFESGVIISTGKAKDAEGPNGTPGSDIGTPFGSSGDPVLTSISGVATNDAAILEFDFVPTSDSVQFRYAFASNEYMEFVGTSVNDVFAFLISGPGIIGEMNVALVPGTATPVTIDNVNANINAQYYIDNENPPGNSVEYNGFTSVFTAKAVLTKCEAYHIRLAIADGGDNVYDSAVFLEAESFTSSSISVKGTSSFSASSTEAVFVEGCSKTSLTFQRPEPYNKPLSAGLLFSGSGIVGKDISSLPNAISFAPGEGTVTLSFDVLKDGLSEGDEDLVITVDQPTCGGSEVGVFSFIIQDPVPLTVQISPDIAFSCPQDYPITVTPTSGYQDYSYVWFGSSETTASITSYTKTTKTYVVEVTDACGRSVVDSATVDMSAYTPMKVQMDNVVSCGGEEVVLSPLVTGGTGDLRFLWSNGTTDKTYSFAPSSNTTTIDLQITDRCEVVEEVSAQVLVDDFMGEFYAQMIANDAFKFVNKSSEAVQFFWEFGDGSTSRNENPQHQYSKEGVYEVTLTSVNTDGCTSAVTQEVTAYSPFRIYVPNSFTPNGDGLNDSFGLVGEGYLHYDLHVFNKLGQRIFTGRFTGQQAWDGTMNGKKVTNDVYTYQILARPYFGETVKRVGSLTVVAVD